MNAKRYALARGAQPRLEIFWGSEFHPVRVTLDGSVIGDIDDRALLLEGAEFPLPDGSTLQVKLVAVFPGQTLRVSQNGIPLPGSPGDPAVVVRPAWVTLAVIALLNVILAAPTWSRSTTLAVVIAVVGVVSAVLAELVRRRMRTALAIATLLYAVDTVAVFEQGNHVASLVHLGLLAVLVRAWLVLRSLPTADDAPVATSTSLDTDGPAPLPSPVTRPSSPSLIVVKGRPLNARFYLQKDRPLTIGAGVTADLVVPDAAHLQVRVSWVDAGLSVTTRGGTAVVNGAAITNGSLAHAAAIDIGPSLSLRVDVPSDAVGTSVPATATGATAPRVSSPVPPSTSSPPPPVRPVAPPMTTGPVRAASRTPSMTTTQRRRRSGAPRFLVAVLAVLLGAALSGGYYWLRRPPLLAAITPEFGFEGTELVLTGERLVASKEEPTVRFDGNPAEIIVASQDTIRVKVPHLATASKKNVAVNVETPRGYSEDKRFEFRVRPEVDLMDPAVGKSGVELTLSGLGFDGGAVKVSITAVDAELLETTPTRLRVRVPSIAGPADARGPVPVVVSVNGEALPPQQLWLGTLPFLVDVQPESSGPGDEVKVTGFGFDANPSGNHVSIGGREALVLSASPTSLNVSVPFVRPVDADFAVLQVEAHGARSNGGPTLAVKLSRQNGFALQFIPTKVGRCPDCTAVASELAPVLILKARGSAASVVERARAVAASLNQLATLGYAGDLRTLEVRTTPEGVALAAVGQQGVVTSVAPEDAAAYGPDVAPQDVAAHWADLLNDYFAICVKRQRPTTLVQRNPRGRALLDLYRTIVRGSTVLADAPERVSADLSAQLLDAAFGAQRAPTSPRTLDVAATLEGVWAGTARGEWGAPTSITLTLRRDGNQLTGTLRLNAEGGGGADQTLKDIRFEKGELSFTVGSDARKRLYRGTLEGGTIKGVTRPAAGAGAEGRFEVSSTSAGAD